MPSNTTPKDEHYDPSHRMMKSEEWESLAVIAINASIEARVDHNDTESRRLAALADKCVVRAKAVRAGICMP